MKCTSLGTLGIMVAIGFAILCGFVGACVLGWWTGALLLWMMGGW